MKLFFTWLNTGMLLMGIIFARQTHAQTGSSALTPIILANGTVNNNYTLNDTITWFKWQADSTTIELDVKLINQGSQNSFVNFEVYIGADTNLLSIKNLSNVTDSLLKVPAYHLDHQTFWIKVRTLQSGCTTCAIPLHATINIQINNLARNSAVAASGCENITDVGFESYSGSCAAMDFNYFSNYNFAETAWNMPNGAYGSVGTADYFNNCAPPQPGPPFSVNGLGNFGSNNIGPIAPHGGAGYAGIFVYSIPSSACCNSTINPVYREYVTQPTSLTAGKTYQLEMWVRLAHISKYAVPNIQMALTAGPLTQVNCGNIGVSNGSIVTFTTGAIQDKFNWTHLTACFTPTVNLNWVTIGNFDNNTVTAGSLVDLDPANTWTYTPFGPYQPNEHDRMSYYYIDDVSITSQNVDAGPDLSICPGNSVPLNGSICYSPNETVTYNWAPNTGLSSTTVLNPVASPVVNTTYTLTATFSFTNTSGSVCTYTLSDALNISVVTPTLSLSAVVSPTNNFCSNTTVTLTPNVGSNLTYTWTNGVTTYTNSNPVITPINSTPNPVSYVYTLTTIACGQTYSTTVGYTVQPGPGFTITPTTICESGTVAVSISNSTLTAIAFGDGNTPSNPHTYNYGGTYTVSVSVYNPACPTTFTNVINVLSGSTPTISATVNPSAFCIDDQFTLTAYGASTYTIDYGFGSTTANPSNHSLTSATVFTITGTDVCNITSQYTVNISPQAGGVSISASQSTLCSNVYNYTATPTGCLSGSTVFQWIVTDFSSAVIYGPVYQGNTFSYTYGTPGSYDVTASIVGPTHSYTISQQNSTTHIGTLPSSSVITATPTAINVCIGSTGTLSATGATTYTWTSGSGNYVGNPYIISPTVSETYTVTSTDGCGRISTDTVQVTATTPNSLSIFASQYSVCIGTGVVLNAFGFYDGTWSNGDMGTSITIHPTTTTIYTITGQTYAGCIGSATITINVNSANTFSISAAASPSIICAGGSSTLTTAGPGSSPVWTPGGPVPSIVVSPTVTSTYSVTSTNASTGCTSSTVVTVNVNTPPVISTNPSTICSGQTSTLTASGAATYTWSTGAHTATIVVSPSITTNYTVTGTSANGCTTSTVTTVHVNVMSVTATASPTISCPGSNVVLSSTGAGSSTIWYPGPYAGTTITVTPSITTTYTVQNSNPITGCSNTATVTVSISATPTLMVNSATICAGQSATLTASGAVSYTWSTGVHTAAIVVTPTVIINYTVTGSNAAGCTGTAVSTVSVQPAGTFTLNASATNMYPITGSSITTSVSVSPSGTYTYSWSPGGGTGSSSTFTPTDNAIYTCTVTNQCSVSNTVSLCVCIESTLCSTPSATTISSATLTANQTFSNTSVSITGTLTIASGAALFFYGSTVKMSTDAKIIIAPTSQIVIDGSKIFSCEGMWFGIEAQSTTVSSASVSVRASTIEDAYHSVQTQHNFSYLNNNITVTTSIMNKNYIDVILQHSASSLTVVPYPLIVQSSTLSSSASTTSPGNSLKCSNFYNPTVKSRSYAGLYADQVQLVDFINNNTSSVFTSLINKDYGLFFIQTNASVYNVQFSEMASILTPGSLPVGIGIYSRGGQNYLRAKPVSSPVANALNFKNVGYGIVTQRVAEVEVISARFTNPSQSLSSTGIIGKAGVYAIDAFSLLRVNTNSVAATYYPITASFSVSPVSPNYTLSISQNALIPGTGTLSTAIDVSSVLSIPLNGLIGDGVLAANSIANASEAGIRISNVTGLIGLRVSGNTISLNNLTTGVRNGILLNGGNNNIMVDNNTIDGHLTASPVGNFNIDQTGIRSVNSPGCFIQCNTITNTGKGIVYTGNNATSGAGAGSEFFKNTLTYPIRRGFELNTGAVIGTQGSSGGASANVWSGFSNITNVDQTSVGTGATSSNAINSILYVHNNTSELTTDNVYLSPSFVGNEYSSGTSLITTASGDYTACPTALTTGARVILSEALNMTHRDADYTEFIGSVLTSTDVTSQAKWLLKQWMHRSIRTTAVGSNTTIASFYATEQAGDPGKYYEIDSLIGAGDTTNARSKNNAAPVNNDIEQTYHDYMNLYLSGVTTSEEYGALNAIANLCADIYGNAVYRARALVNLINYSNDTFTETCDYGSGSRTGNFKGEEQGVAIAENIIARLYPNPNNGNFTLAYDLKQLPEATVQLLDITGQIIYTTRIDNLNNLLKINTNELNNGMYFIQLISTKTLLWTDKVMISK